ncbi:hypothetical protein ATANTOWER_003901 [Ataeniobius toweri]|uniref:Uncharacterized protein n=1 Tax=Ataeniobius toweri TaxID=208326 RepID=A0ABU7BMM5_9TELE|nr:hypothetical protein [Ataeniobius toweri]
MKSKTFARGIQQDSKVETGGKAEEGLMVIRENTDLVKNLCELCLITEGKHLNHCDSERYRAFRYAHLRLTDVIDCWLMNVKTFPKIYSNELAINLYTLNFKWLTFTNK